MIIRLVRIFSTNEERTKMKRERERKGGDDISIRWRYEAVVDGDFGTVGSRSRVVARVRPGQGSEGEAYDAVAPAVGIYAQLRRSNEDGRKKEG